MDGWMASVNSSFRHVQNVQYWCFSFHSSNLVPIFETLVSEFPTVSTFWGKLVGKLDEFWSTIFFWKHPFQTKFDHIPPYLSQFQLTNVDYIQPSLKIGCFGHQFSGIANCSPNFSTFCSIFSPPVSINFNHYQKLVEIKTIRNEG